MEKKLENLKGFESVAGKEVADVNGGDGRNANQDHPSDGGGGGGRTESGGGGGAIIEPPRIYTH